VLAIDERRYNMTREETVKWLESLKSEIGKLEHRSLWHYAEAIDMAIEALSEDKISRAELFNRLAVIKSPAEANEYKAEVYKIINEM
jgi:hypothetical protein